MTFKKIEINPANTDAKKKILKKYAPNDQEYKAILEHLRLLALGEISRHPISEKRQEKIINMFILFFKLYKKPTTTLTLKALQDFKEAMLNDKFLKDNGNPYADDTKEDLTETICRYLECTYPEKLSSWASKYGKSFRKWFVIKAARKTPEYLNEDEVEKLYNACKTIEGKYLIAVLFDLGCRIEEFLNIRFEDIESPTTNFPYYRIDLKEEYSKTEGRKCGMYWKHSTEAITRYLAICEKKDNKDVVFPKEYDACRMFLLRLSKKILGKKVNPHMLRKSSATHYADQLNRQQMCVRFGWKFSSDMPDVYIARKGVDESKVKEVMFNNDLNGIQKENKELKTQMDLQNKEIAGLKSTIDRDRVLTLKVINALNASIKGDKKALDEIRKEIMNLS